MCSVGWLIVRQIDVGFICHTEEFRHTNESLYRCAHVHTTAVCILFVVRVLVVDCVQRFQMLLVVACLPV